jgi:pilus assembly protein Flp/PilA
MKKLKNNWSRFCENESGATAIEYGLIASIMALGLIPVLGSTSSGVASLYQQMQDNFAAVGM